MGMSGKLGEAAVVKMGEDVAKLERTGDRPVEGSGEAAEVAGVSGTSKDSAMSGFSKSQRTPCLRQLPQRGCISSHYSRDGQHDVRTAA